MVDDEQESKLELAACAGDVAQLKCCVSEDGFDPKSHVAACALEGAAQGGQWDAVTFLVRDVGVDLIASNSGAVVLQYAAVAGRLDIMAVALAAGASLQSKVGANVLLSSASTGQLDIFKYAMQNGADILSDGGQAAWGAANASMWEIVLFILEASVDLAVDGVGVQLLALAAVRDQVEVVTRLKDKGISVKSEDGVTALMGLSSTRTWDIYADVVKYLVVNGVALDSEAGSAALRTAALYGDLEMVQCIVKGGANLQTEAAGEALARAGELGPRGSEKSVGAYLAEVGVVAPPALDLVLDADF